MSEWMLIKLIRYRSAQLFYFLMKADSMVANVTHIFDVLFLFNPIHNYLHP